MNTTCRGVASSVGGRTEAVGSLGRGPRPVGCQTEQETGGAGLVSPTPHHSKPRPILEGKGPRECPKGNDMDSAEMEASP